VPVEEPGPLGVETPTLPVAQPTLSVDAPESIPVEMDGVPVSISVGSGDGAMQSPPELAHAPLSRHVGRTAQAGGDIVPGVGHVAGGLVGVGTFIGQELGIDGRIGPGQAGFRGNPDSQQQYQQALQRRRERFFGTGAGPDGAGRVDEVEITVEYDVEMGDITIEDIDHRRLKREIKREQEKQREKAIRRLKQSFE